MGAEPWSSFTKFDSDIQRALDKLRRDVFAAGAYRYAEENPSSIEEALEISDADGTASILDIQQVSDKPDFCCAAPFSARRTENIFWQRSSDASRHRGVPRLLGGPGTRAGSIRRRLCRWQALGNLFCGLLFRLIPR